MKIEMLEIGRPLNIEVLMYYAVRQPGVDFPRMDAPAVFDAHRDLCEAGAIQVHGCSGKWQATELGVAWLKAMCKTKKPRLVFVDERDEVLEMP